MILRVFAQLPSPLDLFHASLANTTWRSIAIDPRLWETHYWTFYRAPYYAQTEQDRLLLNRRTFTRYKALRAWCDASVPPGPPSQLGPLMVKRNDGPNIYRPLAAGLEVLCKLVDSEEPGNTAALHDRLHGLAKEHGRQAPADPQAATYRIMSALFQEFRADDSDACLRWKETLDDYGKAEQEPPSYPHFLNAHLKEERETAVPDFYDHFRTRVNADERLLLALRTLLGVDCGIIDAQLQLIEQYGDGARDLLAALCADQRLSEQNIDCFASFPGAASSEIKSKQDWPRAFDVHQRAALGESQPLPNRCLALYQSAERLLSHLQRREAVRSMIRLQQAQPHSPQAPLTERVLDYGRGAENVFESLALFRFGEPSEVREYLDLLALYVWADHDAFGRWEGHFVKRASFHDNEDDDATPLGSTRYRITCVETSLRRLGFRVASESEQDGTAGDYDDFFINSSMFCPAQRATSPYTYMAILCFVATRLGIPMALTQTVRHGMAVVLEQTPEPEGGWAGRDWSHFYLMPSPDGRWCLQERSELLGGKAAVKSRKAIETSLEPATPLQVLRRAAEDMRQDKHGRLAFDWLEDDRQGNRVSPAAASHQSLRELHGYLTGTTATLPAPLVPATMPSSLVFLPPTSANAPRANSTDLLKNMTAYCASWALSFTDTSSPTGWLRISPTIYEAISMQEPLSCDLALLIEATGGNVSSELAALRSKRKANGNGISNVWTAAAAVLRAGGVDAQEVGQAPAAVREFVALALSKDAEPNEGTGGRGAAVGTGGKRERELLMHSHPLNKAVEHGVGTIFTHRTFGYRAVIMGWDSKGDVEFGQKVGMDFVSRARRKDSEAGDKADSPSLTSSRATEHPSIRRHQSALLSRLPRRRYAPLRCAMRRRGLARTCRVDSRGGYRHFAALRSPLQPMEGAAVLPYHFRQSLEGKGGRD